MRDVSCCSVAAQSSPSPPVTEPPTAPEPALPAAGPAVLRLADSADGPRPPPAASELLVFALAVAVTLLLLTTVGVLGAPHISVCAMAPGGCVLT